MPQFNKVLKRMANSGYVITAVVDWKVSEVPRRSVLCLLPLGSSYPDFTPVFASSVVSSKGLYDDNKNEKISVSVTSDEVTKHRNENVRLWLKMVVGEQRLKRCDTG